MFRESVAAALAVLSLGAIGVSTASADARPRHLQVRRQLRADHRGTVIANSMLCITNNERRAAGLAPLTNNTKLTKPPSRIRGTWPSATTTRTTRPRASRPTSA